MPVLPLLRDLRPRVSFLDSPGRYLLSRAAIPPNVGTHYRSTEMHFWNEDLPNLLRHPNPKDTPARPRGPRPQILDFADGIGRYANATANRKYETYSARSVVIKTRLINLARVHPELAARCDRGTR